MKSCKEGKKNKKNRKWKDETQLMDKSDSGKRRKSKERKETNTNVITYSIPPCKSIAFNNASGSTLFPRKQIVSCVFFSNISKLYSSASFCCC